MHCGLEYRQFDLQIDCKSISQNTTDVAYTTTAAMETPIPERALRATSISTASKLDMGIDVGLNSSWAWPAWISNLSFV